MEIQGKIFAILPMQSGVSQRSGKQWRRASYVLITTDSQPHYFRFDILDSGDDKKIESYNIQQDHYYTVFFNIRASDNGRGWYNQVYVNDVREYKPEQQNNANNQNQQNAQQKDAQK